MFSGKRKMIASGLSVLAAQNQRGWIAKDFLGNPNYLQAVHLSKEENARVSFCFVGSENQSKLLLTLGTR